MTSVKDSLESKYFAEKLYVDHEFEIPPEKRLVTDEAIAALTTEESNILFSFEYKSKVAPTNLA